MIRSLITESPVWTNIMLDQRIAHTTFKTAKDAFLAFGMEPLIMTLACSDLCTEGLNGYVWKSTTLNAVLLYPDMRCVVHPKTDETTALPLHYFSRTLLGRRDPSLLQKLSAPTSQHHRRPQHSSSSSASSQTSSLGGPLTPPIPSSPVSRMTPRIFTNSWAEILTLQSVYVDTRTGEFLDADTALGLVSFQLNPIRRLRYMQGQDPTRLFDATTPLPSYDYQCEHRSIIIRELSFSVTQQQLLGHLHSHRSEGHCTIKLSQNSRRCHAIVDYPMHRQAAEAVRNLNGTILAGRTLSVEIAADKSTVHERRHSHVSTPESYESATTPSTIQTAPGIRRCGGPIIADGSL